MAAWRLLALSVSFTMLYFARPALKFSMNAGHSMNSPLKVGKGMVGGLMGCLTMIGPDVETVV